MSLQPDVDASLLAFYHALCKLLTAQAAFSCSLVVSMLSCLTEMALQYQVLTVKELKAVPAWDMPGAKCMQLPDI